MLMSINNQNNAIQLKNLNIQEMNKTVANLEK